MNKMNIWYLSAYDQPKGHSSRTYDFSLELVKRGHQITMFTNSYCHWTHTERLSPHEKWRIEEIDGIRVVWLRTIHYTGNGFGRGMNMLSNAWRCIQVSRTLSDKPDVVIGPSVPLLTGWAALKIARMKGAAFVFEVRDVWPLALVYSSGLSKRSPVYYTLRFLEKYLYRKAERISSTLPNIFQHVSDSGGNPDKVVWIPNGVNLDSFTGFNKYEGRDNLPLVAMYIGGFGAEHDVMTIVRAANILQQKGDNRYRFVIIGNGPKRLACQNEAISNKLSNIEFRDPVPKSDIPKIQMEADILIAAVIDTPVYRFGLNLNKIYDYLASGRPVIFSGNAPKDPISITGAGFSIPPEDPIAMVDALEKYLKMSADERIKMGKLGRKWVENEFDMRKLGERMESLLFQVIKDRKQ
jgi:glycosyltransferase involved in cell wall biosynthesis